MRKKSNFLGHLKVHNGHVSVADSEGGAVGTSPLPRSGLKKHTENEQILAKLCYRMSRF